MAHSQRSGALRFLAVVVCALLCIANVRAQDSVTLQVISPQAGYSTGPGSAPATSTIQLSAVANFASTPAAPVSVTAMTLSWKPVGTATFIPDPILNGITVAGVNGGQTLGQTTAFNATGIILVDNSITYSFPEAGASIQYLGSLTLNMAGSFGPGVSDGPNFKFTVSLDLGASSSIYFEVRPYVLSGFSIPPPSPGAGLGLGSVQTVGPTQMQTLGALVTVTSDPEPTTSAPTPTPTSADNGLTGAPIPEPTSIAPTVSAPASAPTTAPTSAMAPAAAPTMAPELVLSPALAPSEGPTPAPSKPTVNLASATAGGPTPTPTNKPKHTKKPKQNP